MTPRTLRNWIYLGLLSAIVLAMAGQCFGQIDTNVVGYQFQDENGWTEVPYPPSGGGDMYFVDQDGGNDANDGRDPNGFDLSTATYTHSTRTLTSSGAFSGYTHTGGDRTDVIYITGATGGVASGYYIIESKTSNDAIVLEAAAGLTADATGVSSSDGPVSSLAAGYALLTTDQDDQLLFQRGDTWVSSAFGLFFRSGKSASEPLLISAYGTGARPQLDSGDTSFMTIRNQDYVYVISLDVQATRVSGDPDGITVSTVYSGGTYWTSTDILIEDCRIDGFNTNTQASPSGGGQISNITLRRNQIINSYALSGTSSGFYSTAIDNLVVEENFFDHNGWNDPLDGADVFSHNMYITHETLSCIVRRNISSRSSSIGCKFQPVQGTHYIYNNIFVRNAYSCQYGGGKSDAQVPGQGIELYAYNNIHAEEQDNGTNQRIGVTITNVEDCFYRNNLNIHATGRTTQNIGLRAYEGGGVGAKDFVVDGNVSFNWQAPHAATYSDLSTVTFTNNVTQEPDLTEDVNLIQHSSDYFGTATNNTWFSNRAAGQRYKANGSQLADYAAYVAASGETGGQESEVSFTDDTRTVTTWATTQKGLADYDAFVAGATANRKGSWDNDYTTEVIGTWLRAGYDLEEYEFADPGVTYQSFVPGVLIQQAP